MAKHPEGYRIYASLRLFERLLKEHGPNSVFVQKPFVYDVGSGRPVYQPYFIKGNPDTTMHDPEIVLVGHEVMADFVDTRYKLLNRTQIRDILLKKLRWGKFGRVCRAIKRFFIKE